MADIIYSGKNLPSKYWKDANQLIKIAQNPVKKHRPYTAQITRTTPTAFVFLIDQSGSMGEKVTIENRTETKAVLLVEFINRMLNDILDKCNKFGDFRNYVDICVIGYGGDAENTAKIAWEGSLQGKSFVKIDELAHGYVSTNEIVVKQARPDGTFRENKKSIFSWLTPKAASRTPMHDAFSLGHDLLVEWLNKYPNMDIYPPTIFNISDGYATDTTADDLLDICSKIKNISTMDGNALIYNIQLSTSKNDPVLFPCDVDELPDDKWAHLLFDMSSDLPDTYNNAISVLTMKDLRVAYTGLAYNCEMSKLISLLNIGTSTPLKNAK